MPFNICVIGLGYVGLPLAVALDRAGHRVIGFDISARRVKQLQSGYDTTKEIALETLQRADIVYADEPSCIASASVVIVTVPTPVTEDKQPDLSPLEKACHMIGKHVSPGTTVVFESTVYPGVTEEFCGPIIAGDSGLVWKKDFFLGYSPERINPGDKEHTIDRIVKVIAGDTPATVELLKAVYGPITAKGLHVAESIKVAEAAKVIENTQRDLNIALMNELSIIFEKLGISTSAVLDAASTKWNFLRFTPGLVGGHCIGVDPYYLTSCAENLGYKPEVILAGRRVNDNTSARIADRVFAHIEHAGVAPGAAKVAVLGLTFKENVPDIRNSLVFDIIARLRKAGVEVAVCDPVIDPETDLARDGVELGGLDQAISGAHAIIAAVPHSEFRTMGIPERIGDGVLLADVKSMFPELRGRLGTNYWSL